MSTTTYTDRNRLEELGGSDFEIKDGQPNVKGWGVYDLKGHRFGKVTELLFNPASRQVRYLVIDLEGRSRYVLIPIGIAVLHEKDDHVLLPDVEAAQMDALPGYVKGAYLSPESEVVIRRTFVPRDSVVAYDDDFYRHEHFSDDRFYRDKL